jgi:hypothetical protein
MSNVEGKMPAIDGYSQAGLPILAAMNALRSFAKYKSLATCAFYDIE